MFKTKKTNTTVFIHFIDSFSICLIISKAGIRAHLRQVSNSIQHEFGPSYPMLMETTQVLRVQRTLRRKNTFPPETSLSFYTAHPLLRWFHRTYAFTEQNLKYIPHLFPWLKRPFHSINLKECSVKNTIIAINEEKYEWSFFLSLKVQSQETRIILLCEYTTTCGNKRAFLFKLMTTHRQLKWSCYWDTEIKEGGGCCCSKYSKCKYRQV